MRPPVKSVLPALASVLPLLSLCATIFTDMDMDTCLPILMLHDVGDERTELALAPGVFRSGLEGLARAGYHTVSLDDVAAWLHSGASLSKLAFAITFDDGSASVYSRAFPILQQYSFSATVFLTVGENTPTTSETRLPGREGRTMLSWGEIREMQRHGIAFGAHTLTHPNLARLPPDRAEAEMAQSQSVIADALGVPVPTFAYPYGYYNDRTREIASRHFVCACSVRLGLVSAKSDPYALERVDSGYLRTERLFGLMPGPWFPWYVRVRGIPRRIRRLLRWRMG